MQSECTGEMMGWEGRGYALPENVHHTGCTAARKFLTKYIRRKFSYILQGIFVIVYNGRLIIILIVYKGVLQVENVHRNY
jgi:hypothetical protein